MPVLPLDRLQGDVGTVGATRNPPYQNRLGGGMDGWKSSVDGADPLRPTQPVLPRPAQPVPSPQEPRGLPRLLLEYLRNNPDY